MSESTTRQGTRQGSGGQAGAAPGSSGASAVKNPWDWDSKRNPYLHNVLMILGLDDPDAPADAYNAALHNLHSELEVDQAREVYGYRPEQLDEAAAQRLQADTLRLSIERLLMHRAHVPDPATFEPLVKLLNQIDVGRAEAMLPLPVTNVAPLARLVPPLPTPPRAPAAAELDLEAFASLLAPDRREERVLPR